MKNIDPVFEPHHNIINQEQQVQIYEMIMGDVNGNFTTVLERADHFLKDNRIPPDGFLTNSPVYDTVQIVGDALSDADFNKTNNVEGSGRDIVHYHIALNGASGVVNAFAKVYYQSVPPRWVQDMFTYSSPAIDAFKTMYAAADQAPVLAAHDSLLNIALPTAIALPGSPSVLQLMSNTGAGWATIENKNALLIYAVKILQSDGRQRGNILLNSAEHLIPIQLPEQSGIYLLQITTNRGDFVFKVLQAR